MSGKSQILAIVRFSLLHSQCNFDCPWMWGSLGHARPFANLVMVSSRGMTTIGGLTYIHADHYYTQLG